MKALSVKQPYAALIATGQKTLEIRTWQTKYRGELLICAGKIWHNNFGAYFPQKEQLKLLGVKDFVNFNHMEWQALTKGGKAICIVDLVDIRIMKKEDEAQAFCPFIPDAFAWVLENPRLVNQIEVKGQLSLFEVQKDLIHLI